MNRPFVVSDRRVGARIEAEVRGVAEITDAPATGLANEPGKVAWAGVVDDEDLHVPRPGVLLQHRIETLFEVGLSVVERNDDRPEWARLVRAEPAPASRTAGSDALAPVDAPAVDIDDRVRDPARVAEIVDRPAARVDAAVVVDDDEPARRHLVVEGGQRVHRRFIHVAVEAQHREPLDRRGAKRVLEPALEEDDAVVEEPVFGEVRFHLVERNRELLDRVVLVSAIGRIGVRSRAAEAPRTNRRRRRAARGPRRPRAPRASGCRRRRARRPFR